MSFVFWSMGGHHNNLLSKVSDFSYVFFFAMTYFICPRYFSKYYTQSGLISNEAKHFLMFKFLLETVEPMVKPTT